MDEREKWRIKRLEDDNERMKNELDDLQRFKESTVEKLKTVYERIQDLESTNQWISRSFFYVIFGGVISAFGSLIVWLITR
ncbi:hemolysin XhlA family protein [Virgibacillus siamensis]|uniref:hemolysin XhlA family protein n=1 Tax=Virgibacillus siamensis TaxID=480071 RepID=UPI0009860C2C|nr:hemolysin XhlA family protein [Virgibacillus siamensis]